MIIVEIYLPPKLKIQLTSEKLDVSSLTCTAPPTAYT